MRVAMLITSYHPIVGGAERQLAQVASRMQCQGHEVTVVTRHHPGLSRDELVDGTRILRVGVRGPKIVRAGLFILNAARAVRKLGPDVIHCHSLFSPTLAGLLAGWLCGVPVTAKPMCEGEATGIAARRFGRLRLSFYRRRLAAIVAVSAAIRTEVDGLGFPPDRIICIPNGVDLQRFEPAPNADAKAAARRDLGLPDGIAIGYAGRLAAQKNLPLLLRSFRTLSRLRPDVRLVIAKANRSAQDAARTDGLADPDHAGDLPAIADMQVLPQVEDMPRFLQALDIFVLPSAREGLSNALLEACAAGLPTVSARIGGNTDVITDGHDGVLFQPGSEADLLDRLLHLTDNPAERARLGQAARQRVAAAFGLDATVAGLLGLFARLQGSRR